MKELDTLILAALRQGASTLPDIERAVLPQGDRSLVYSRLIELQQQGRVTWQIGWIACNEPRL